MAQINVKVIDGNNISLRVTPLPNNIITLDRGIVGPQGLPGDNNIGGYPIALTSPQNYDALMFLAGSFVNIPQTEIADGGNF